MHISKMISAGLVALMALAAPAAAQDDQDEGRALFGGDRYIAGSNIAVEEDTTRDLFMAGETVALDAPVAGSAHLMGRRLSVSEPIGGNLYAMGYALDLDASVSGSVTATGAELRLSDEITGNLRASGWEIRLEGPVAGSALLAGGQITLNAAIAGDVVIATDDLRFGDGAAVGGTLTIYAEDPDSVSVPDSIAPAGRVEILQADSYDSAHGSTWPEVERPSLASRIGSFLFGVLIVTGLAVALAALMPDRLAELRARSVDHPGQSLWSGFLGLSTLVGAGFVASLTIVGIILLPAAILLAVLAMLVGYVLGVYVLGGAIWNALGRAAPVDLASKALMALFGAVLAALIGLIPFLGWLFALALGLVGVGAMVRSWKLRRQVTY
ncbi:EI24 domain-containing protein [Nioella ostreopsis]|uniref:EI24 domain-containing protein n=1 Tax=Nioella ostreopsis TaxID=2448479 RepID=UPI000FDB0FD5|nr:EI24 domain-containing protein [Nioella ostreopsis]